jgi:predicted AlkP superfamily pyrophosphatase or phosphodiesterase
MLTMYTFDSAKSPFRFLRDDRCLAWHAAARRLIEALPSTSGFRRVKRLLLEKHERRELVYRYWIQNESKRYATHAPPTHIPLQLLPFIGVSEDNRPIHLPGALQEETIFDVFSQEQVPYKFLMFPAVNCDDPAVVQMFLRERNSSARILLGQFSDSDALIHYCGPSSPKRREVAGEIDRRLRDIDSEFGDSATWIIIGDHGMTDVIEEIDIPSVLADFEAEARVLQGRDYLLFLDSTMARFRWLTEKGRTFLDKICELPVLKSKGTFIDEVMAHRYCLPLNDRRYGDRIWWANVGTLVFPDYFHDAQTHNKGMHGYDTDHDDMKGFFLACGPEITAKTFNEVNLVDVCPTLCAAAGVRPPSGNIGKSLLG